MTEKRIWECKHSYYMTQGQWGEVGHHQNFDSIGEFLDEWRDADLDYNRVHRWDFEHNESGEMFFDVFFVLQRKAKLFSCRVKIKKTDETEKKYSTFCALIWSTQKSCGKVLNDNHNL